MRMMPLIAAALLTSSAAGAQSYGTNCRGETLSDLARCAAEQAPPPVEEEAAPAVGAEEPITPRRLQPRSLGGALQPTNQRAAPPRVERAPSPVRPVETAPSGPSDLNPLRGLTNDPTFPAQGAGGSDLERPRLLDPLAGTRIRDADLVGE